MIDDKIESKDFKEKQSKIVRIFVIYKFVIELNLSL